MARYQITGPDGKSYEINAPDDATEDDVRAYVLKEASTPAASKAAEPKGPSVSPVESFGRGALQGATFGFSDEIYGGAKGLYDKAFGSGDFSGTYAKERDAVRAANDRAQQANPTSFFAGEIGGGFAVPGGAAKLGLRGAKTAVDAGLGARSLAAAKEGAAYGAAYGFGKGEGNAPEQAMSTVVGALGGGLLGGAVPGAIQIGSAAFRLPAQAVRTMTSQGSKRLAAEKYVEAMRRDAGREHLGVPNPVFGAANKMDMDRAAGETSMMLADYGGENTKNLMRAAANMPNAATERLNQVLNRRQAVQGRRLGDVLQDTLANGKDFTKSMDDLVAERSRNAAPAFKQGYAKPLTDEADADLGAFFETRGYAKRLLDKVRENVTGMTGQSVDDLQPYELAHRVKMQINREIGNLKRGNPDSVANWSARDLTELNQMLGRIIQHHNPELGTALRRYSDESGLVNALEDGAEDFFKLAPEELGKKLRSLSKDEADLYRVGAARAQVEKLRSGDVMRDRTKSVYGSDDIGLRMKAVFPDGAGRAEFMRVINNARKQVATRRAIQGNSTTAKQLTQGIEAGKTARTVSDVVGTFSGRPGAIANLVERGTNLASGITPKVAEQILKIGMMKDGGSASGLSNRALKAAYERGRARTVRQGLLSDVLLPAPALLSAEFASSSGR